ncbi:MAG: VWA domain-containing protein [Devosia sp.]
MLRSFVRLFAPLTALLGLALPALAADRAIIILDASGSMWAQINGKARIDIARDTLKTVLAGVPSDLELGFMAYGHRSKGDCNDIEMLVDPAPGTADAISAAASKLSPKGKTPLSASVKMAAEQLKYTEDKATVILITDGLETCDADPCAVATELKKSGVDFKVDVVGLALTKKEGDQVRCIADNTDGQYVSADDADGLKTALTTVVTDVAPPSEPASPSSSEEVQPSVNFKPTAVLDESGTPVPAEANVAWEFHKKNADGSEGDWVRTEYGAKFTGDIEPGDYILETKLDNVHVAMPVTITADSVAEPQIDLEAGYIDLTPRIAKGAEVDSSAAVLTEFSNGDNNTYYGEAKAYVPAGDMKVTVTLGAATMTDTITVNAGENVTKDLVLGAGHAEITGEFAEGQSINDSKLFVEIFESKKDIQGNRKSITSGYGPTISVDIAPGDYVAVGTYDAIKVEEPLSIKAGQAAELVIDLNAGALAVTAPGANYVEVFSAEEDLQGNRVSFGGSYDMMATRTLPAGEYHLVVTMKDNSTKEADASVRVGERTEITVQ